MALLTPFLGLLLTTTHSIDQTVWLFHDEDRKHEIAHRALNLRDHG